MLIFGDRRERADPRQRLAAIGDALGAIGPTPSGIARHAAIASALIDAGQLLQGVADADFDQAGRDRSNIQTDRLGSWVLAIARTLRRSWESGFAEINGLPTAPEVPDLPSAVDLKTPEGFAFYAVYPEAYFEAAQLLRLLGTPRVIGIRSIGTTLGAVVAAALDADPPVTVRPFGTPFARQVALDPRLERTLLEGAPHFVIVDEGPGQSGSSFGAVADWLQDRGVPLDRIAFLPSHSGPLGPEASTRHRERWGAAQHEPADFGDRLPQLLATWLGGVLGPLDEEPRDVSAGAWRQVAFACEADWPAAVMMFERRKFVVASGGAQFLVKFAGLGRIGEDKLRMARALHRAAFVAEPVGLAHGFLVERWRSDAKPLAPADRPVDEIGRYLGARARLFPADEQDGASIADLYRMARRNVESSLGDKAAAALTRWEAALGRLQNSVVRVRTDNRLDRHEWLRTEDGRLLKTDAVDHHQAHDLVGCQDLAWDVAGAVIEFDLNPGEVEQLICSSEEGGGWRINRELLDFCGIAYAAFRLGLASFGLPAAEPQEAARLARSRDFYSSRLSELLEPCWLATRQDCLVD